MAMCACVCARAHTQPQMHIYTVYIYDNMCAGVCKSKGFYLQTAHPLLFTVLHLLWLYWGQLTVLPMFMTDFIAYETRRHSSNEQIQLVLFLR